MEKKGFTLIELLAVIVILAIILAIAIPSISGIAASATRGSFESDAKMVLKQYEYKKLEDDSFEYSGVSSLGLSGDNYMSINISIVAGKPYVLIIGKNKWDGLKACGTIKNIDVVQISNDETCVVREDVNPPELATGMIPVKWITDHWVTTTEDDIDWYNYKTTVKKWANVIQVSNPSSYTESGTTVDVENDVIAMWVWIPRYIYNISDGWHEQMTSTTGGTIQVQFSMDTDDTRGGTVTLVNTGSANDSNGTWTSHPAFKFGDDELTGIWVAKFEASRDDFNNVKVVPNADPWRAITISDAFSRVRSMETTPSYGWGDAGTNLDTHLMKNIEWGAVAYLAQSTYGINNEIFTNPSDNFVTGRGGTTVSQIFTGDSIGSGSSNLYSYDGKSCSSKIVYECTGDSQSIYGMASSTTGNIYGIYDMSGGSWEHIAAYIDNGYKSDYGSSIINAVNIDPKYADIYDAGTGDASSDNYDASINHKGDAVYETSETNSSNNWYNDNAYMPEDIGPWFTRGSSLFQYVSGPDAGVFNFMGSNGNGYDSIGFRPVVLVGEEL